MASAGFQIQEAVSTRQTGFLVSKRLAFISAIFIIVFMVGSFIGVFKLKSSSSSSSCFLNITSTTKEPVPDCSYFYCQNPSILNGKLPKFETSIFSQNIF